MRTFSTGKPRADYGSTPRIHLRALPVEPRRPSISDAIAQAASADEVANILALGNAYQGASNGTRKRWKKQAEQRLQELAA